MDDCDSEDGATISEKTIILIINAMKIQNNTPYLGTYTGGVGNTFTGKGNSYKGSFEKPYGKTMIC
jgi:hypothetical protein